MHSSQIFFDVPINSGSLPEVGTFSIRVNKNIWLTTRRIFSLDLYSSIFSVDSKQLWIRLNCNPLQQCIQFWIWFQFRFHQLFSIMSMSDWLPSEICFGKIWQGHTIQSLFFLSAKKIHTIHQIMLFSSYVLYADG